MYILLATSFCLANIIITESGGSIIMFHLFIYRKEKFLTLSIIGCELSKLHTRVESLEFV